MYIAQSLNEQSMCQQSKLKERNVKEAIVCKPWLLNCVYNGRQYITTIIKILYVRGKSGRI